MSSPALALSCPGAGDNPQQLQEQEWMEPEGSQILRGTGNVDFY